MGKYITGLYRHRGWTVTGGVAAQLYMKAMQPFHDPTGGAATRAVLVKDLEGTARGNFWL